MSTGRTSTDSLALVLGLFALGLALAFFAVEVVVLVALGILTRVLALLVLGAIVSLGLVLWLRR